MKKIIINLIGGPGSGKSIFSALLFAEMKMKKYKIEYVQEYAKELVWLKKYEYLKNQHHIALTAYNIFHNISQEVDIIITDGSLLHGLYYNRYEENNYSNVEKTEKAIMEYYNEFYNINIFIERNPKIEYEKAGRLQKEKEAKQIDILFEDILNEKDINYIKIVSDIKNKEKMLKYIENQIEGNLK
jgi:thymidylate kinase